MTQPLIVVTAGGLAREVVEVARATEKFDVVGYVDDDADLLGTTLLGVPVIGGLDAVATRPEAAVVVAAGHGRTRMALVDRLRALGVDDARYASVVHPSVHVPSSCTIGGGCIVLGGVTLTASVRLGEHVVVMPNVTLTHDDVVDDYATLCAGVVLGGEVHVGAGAYVGMAASVRERVRIGGEATVGMGAVVLQDVPADETWIGVPGRRLTQLPGT